MRIAVLSVLAGLLMAPAASAVPDSPTHALPNDFLALERYFEKNPDLKFKRGTGWNPYPRLRWFSEHRLTNGQAPPPGARWEIWKDKTERFSGRSAQATWFEIGPVNMSGRILSIAFDPNNADIVYVGAASGGLWKSTDGGDNWVTTTDELPALSIGGVCVSPNDPNIVLIATGEGTLNFGRVGGVGILKSTDAGQTWNTTGLTYAVNSGSGFHFLEASQTTGVILGGGNDNLWRSTDDGDTWNAVQSGTFFDAKWDRSGGSTRVYTIGGGSAFSGGNTFQVSTDDGLNWTNSTSGLPGSGSIGKSKIAVGTSSPNTLYAHLSSTSTFGTIGIYRSLNAGASWSAQNTSDNIGGGQAWYNLTLAVDPDNASTVVAGGVENWRSTNSGVTFVEVGDGFGLGTNTAIHWDHHAIVYEPGSTNNLWVGTDGGVWRSTDDGANWTSRREGIATYQFYDICVAQSDPDFLMGGTQDNGVPGRVGSTDTWSVSNLFADGMVCNVNPFDASVIYAEWQFGNQVKSTDSGGSWFSIQGSMPASGGQWITPVALDPTDPNRLYTELGGTVYRTTNGGSSWSNVGSHTAEWIDVNPAVPSIVWLVDATLAPRVSTNSGGSWTVTSSYPFSTAGNATKILADPVDPSAAFVTFTGYGSGAHIARTTDLGATWNDVSGDFPAQPVNAIEVDPQFPGEWYIGTDVGVWTSTNGGVNWTPFDSGLPNAVVLDLEIRDADRKLVAGTHGRGAFEVGISGGVVDVAVGGAPAPLNLMLDSPRPNPATERTMLRFAARATESVSLDIYDVGGRRIVNLADFSRGDGIIRGVPWITTDVPAGVYFAVLRAGADQVSRKVIVAK